MFGLRSRRHARDMAARLAAIGRSQAVVEFTPDGTVLTANENFLRIMGYALADIVGRHHAIFMPPGEADSTEFRNFWADLARGDFKSALFRRVGQGGREVWLQATYSPVLDASGKVVKVMKIAVEVSAAVRDGADTSAQVRAIRRSQAVAEFGLDGTILSANDNFLRAVGYRHDDIVGRHHSMFVPAAERDGSAYREFWAALARGEYRAGEFRRVGRDGRDVWWQATYNPVFDAEGRPVKIVKFGTDVSAARTASVNSQGQYAAVQLTQAVIEFGLDGSVLSANENFLFITGYALDEIIGRHHAIFVDPAERFSMEYLAFWDSLRAGQFRGGEFRRLRKDGGEVWLRATYTPIFDLAGRPFKVVKFAYDVTPQVVARERLQVANADLARLARHMHRAQLNAEQASRAKTRFLAGMSHELRTPLNGILGYAQLLRMDGDLTPLQLERVQGMLAAGTHLLEMITCVLDLSEIETDKAALHAAAVDIAGLAEACLGIVRPAAETRGLALRLAVAPDVPGRFTADPRRLRQVLLNLLGNAVKFTTQGSVELRIRAAPAGAAAGASLCFEVADTGPGIAAGLRARLFGDFERLDVDGARIVEGAGLGLSLSKRVAALMGGELEHADNPSGGSLFRLTLPLVGADAPVPPPPPQAAADVLAPALLEAANKPILVVDDIAMNRDIAGCFIQSAGFATVCVDSGEAAVAAAAEADYLLVLMDVRMPGMDGLEATRRIRALPGARGRVPIVALTAQVFTEQIEICRAAGMDVHVAKPFTEESLLGAIARALAAGPARAASLVPAPTIASEDAAATAPRRGADLPVLNEATLDRTSATLKPAAVQTYLETLAGRAEALSTALQAPGALAGGADSLAEAAHALAGSAGMFGFERLVFAARHFERSVKADPSEAAALSESLGDALAASIPVMQRRAKPIWHPEPAH